MNLIFFLNFCLYQTHARLNQQASNFQREISELEDRIASEAKAAAELRRLQAERANEGETAAEARRTADDKVLKGLRTFFDSSSQRFGKWS